MKEEIIVYALLLIVSLVLLCILDTYLGLSGMELAFAQGLLSMTAMIATLAFNQSVREWKAMRYTGKGGPDRTNLPPADKSALDRIPSCRKVKK